MANNRTDQNDDSDVEDVRIIFHKNKYLLTPDMLSRQQPSQMSNVDLRDHEQLNEIENRKPNVHLIERIQRNQDHSIRRGFKRYRDQN